MVSTIPLNKLDVNAIEYRPTQSRKSIKATLRGEMVYLQLNRLKLNGKPDTDNYEFVISGSTQEKMSEFEDHIVDMITTRSEELFKKEIPRAAVKDMFRGCLNISGKNTTLRLKTPWEDIGVWVSKDQELDVSSLNEDDTVNAVVEFSGLWFRKEACGYTFTLRSLKVCPAKKEAPKVTKAYSFIDDSDNDEPVLEEHEVASVYQTA